MTAHVSEAGSNLDEAAASAFQEIFALARQPNFQELLVELSQLPFHLQQEFVELVVIDPFQLEKRGIKVPEDLVVQRSQFGDNRPTLFCITKKLPSGVGWDKVTLTFDSLVGK